MIFDNWEIEAPDGSVKITKLQMMQAQAVYDGLDWTKPPLLDYVHTLDGEHSAMAGCVGAVLHLSHDETVTMYETNKFFRDLIESLLEARAIFDRLQLHRNANLS